MLAKYCRYSQSKGLACTYRLRSFNFNKKVGNLQDFIDRFSLSFEGMIVLDADSLMSGRSVVMLSKLLQDNPSVGLVQLQPMPVRQTTMFGRVYQFSACAFAELFAHGYAFWWLDSSSFIGHNAIVRIEPFKTHCGLPMLPLRGPLGGHVLSHDHVEAALLRKAGWAVWMIPLGDGSYEEIPTNLLDHLARDFRWLVGELQHLQLITQPGLDALARFQLFSGVLSYMANPLWLYTWLIAAHEMAQFEWGAIHPLAHGDEVEAPRRKAMVLLLCLSAILVAGSRVQLIILCLLGREPMPGGVVAFMCSLVVELLFSSCVTPMIMGFVTISMIKIVFLGRTSSWSGQNREGNELSFCDVIQRSGSIAAFFGLLPLAYYALQAKWAALWLSPLSISVLLAVPLAKISSGDIDWQIRLGLFASKFEERVPQEVIDFENSTTTEELTEPNPLLRKSNEPEVTARTQGSLCILCASNPRTHMVAPCGHRCLCGDCAAKIVLPDDDSKKRGSDWSLKVCPVCSQVPSAVYEIVES